MEQLCARAVSADSGQCVEHVEGGVEEVLTVCLDSSSTEPKVGSSRLGRRLQEKVEIFAAALRAARLEDASGKDRTIEDDPAATPTREL